MTTSDKMEREVVELLRQLAEEGGRTRVICLTAADLITSPAAENAKLRKALDGLFRISTLEQRMMAAEFYGAALDALASDDTINSGNASVTGFMETGKED